MIDPVLDGTGGGFGKHAGIPVREVLAIFERAAEEPKMRSVRTIVRIGKEQIEARGSLNVNGKVAGLFLGLAAVAGGIWVLKVPTLAESAPYAVLVCLGIAGVMAIGSLSTRKDRRANLAQEKIIRDGVRNALARLSDHPELKREPLDWSDRNALDKLIGRGHGW